MYNAQAIDAQCEREALALSTLALLTDADIPTDPRVEISRAIELAKQLGVVQKPTPRYPRLKIIRRLDAIYSAIDNGQPVPRAKFELPVTREDRLRRKAKREAKRIALAHLARMKGDTTLNTLEAAKLSTIPASTLQKAVKRGELSAQKVFPRREKNVCGRGEYRVTISSLRSYLSSRCKAA